MNNITLRELENERKHKIANLSKEEASNYIDSLNERIAAAIGGMTNGFYTDVEEIKKNTDLCYEVGELLTRTYPNIKEVIAASRNNILLKKYEEDTLAMYHYTLDKDVRDLILLCTGVEYTMLILNNVMWIYYDSYRMLNHTQLTSKLYDAGMTYEEMNQLEGYFNKIPVYDLYDKYFMDSMDIIIKPLISMLDIQAERLKDCINFTFKDSDPSGTYYDTYKENMLKYQQQAHDLLDEYDALLMDGFYKVKELELKRELKSERNEGLTKDYLEERIKRYRPSYDLKTMTFIPSEFDQELMDEIE